MKSKFKKDRFDTVDLNKIDLLSLKRKGLSNTQISKMIGVSNYEIDKRLKHQESFKKYSGVF